MTSSSGQVAAAALWAPNGAAFNLGGLPSTNYAGAAAINSQGAVVGWSETAAGQIHAVRWVLSPTALSAAGS
jgi:uncharacterized membrane protein